MKNDKLDATDAAGAMVERRAILAEALNPRGHFEVECLGPDGKLKWRDEIENLVVYVGKNSMLDKFLDLGAAHSNVVMGLKGTGATALANTMASHAPWLEVGLANAPTYTGNRKTPAFSAAANGSKATTAAQSFAITSSGTVSGCFVAMSASTTKDDTTGTLLSVGDFGTGDKTVGNGDTLNVTYSLAL
jgi:hypothetical protein